MHEDALYMQIRRQLLADIRGGRYPENSRLPTERMLCQTYHVSRSTIRQTLACLKEDGLVYSVQGNGTFVLPQMFTQPLTKLYSFTDTLKSSNILIKNDIVSYDIVQADLLVARKTSYPEHTAFHRLVRLRSAEDYPLMLETTYLPCSRFVKLNMQKLSGSLYEQLREKYGFHVDHATETFQAVLAGTKEAELLKLPSGTPCILLERFSYEDGMLIEYTRSTVRGDKYVFRVELK